PGWACRCGSLWTVRMLAPCRERRRAALAATVRTIDRFCPRRSRVSPDYRPFLPSSFARWSGLMRAQPRKMPDTTAPLEDPLPPPPTGSDGSGPGGGVGAGGGFTPPRAWRSRAWRRVLVLHADPLVVDRDTFCACDVS